jgi:hypothetical protein
MAAADLSRDDVARLVELTRRVDAIETRLAPELLELKEARKQMDAIVATARASLIDSGKTERRRFGVVFKLVEKAGTVAWKGLCESIKGKEWCQMKAAEAPRKTECVYRIAD